MDSVWLDVLSRTKSFVKHPERFLVSQDNNEFDKSKILLKVLYDASKIATGDSDSTQAMKNTLPELIINDFDEEQVWTAIDLQNEFVKDECVNKFQRLLCLPHHAFSFTSNKESEETVESDEDELPLQKGLSDSEDDDLSMEGEESGNESEGSHVSSEQDDEDNDENDVFNDPDFQHMSDSDLDDKLPLFDKTDSEDSDEDNEKEEAKEEELESKTEDYMANAMKAMKSRGGQTQESEIEDQFLKLDEMDKFLDAEDAKAMRESPDVDDNDDIDYFGASEEEDNDEVTKTMYKDFFEKATDSGEVKRDILDGDDDDHMDQSDEFGEVKSTHEMRTLRLQKKIQQLENEAVDTKPWQLTGEVAAVERPDNALLEEDLDFDTVTKQAPVITEEVSKRLEDIIKQRIKDQSWDDVERKVKPVENPYDYKKKLILDQEKSKLSLAQVYEEEYLQQKGDLETSKKTPGMLDEEEEDKPETLDEIKSRMKDLFAKLDILTHYHYTPQAINADVKVVRNMPTIAMEEVAPVAMSDANLLAPQEIVDKKRGDEIGSSERDLTDKKRDLRLKKAKQRKKKVAREKQEKMISKLNPALATKYSKKAALKAMEQAEKEGKIKTIKEKNKAVKSSKAFFDQMQNEVTSIVSDIKAERANKKQKRSKNAASFKL